jgi:hypothetical protein
MSSGVELDRAETTSKHRTIKGRNMDSEAIAIME